MSFWWALQLLFIGLKLGGVLAWSWWEVLFPALLWAVVFSMAMLAHRYFMCTNPSYALKHYLNQMKRQL